MQDVTCRSNGVWPHFVCELGCDQLDSETSLTYLFADFEQGAIQLRGDLTLGAENMAQSACLLLREPDCRFVVGANADRIQYLDRGPV
jgi:hypothetical protein